MAHPKTIKYKGNTYHLQTTGRYYQDGSRDHGRERLLHRFIWTEHHGPIPKGAVVHHENGDWTDNRISNLALRESNSAHMREHMIEHWKNPDFAKKAQASLRKAVKKAAEWHKSIKGSQFAKDVAKRGWEGRSKEHECKCRQCGEKFLSWVKTATICSPRCRWKDKANNRKHRVAPKTCVVCQSPFKDFKYGKAETCSAKCRAVHGHERSGRRKLSTEDIKEIRLISQSGLSTQKEIGDRFGVSRSAIGAVLDGRIGATA